MWSAANERIDYYVLSKTAYLYKQWCTDSQYKGCKRRRRHSGARSRAHAVSVRGQISTIDPAHIGRHSCLPLPGDALLSIRLSPSPPDGGVVIYSENLRVFKQRVANTALVIVSW